MKRTHFILWMPVVAYYAVITFFSGLYGDQIAGIVKYPFAGFDKIIHVSEYFFFGMVLSRALAWEQYYKHIKNRWSVYFALILPLAALIDEIHQYFVPSRDMNFFDWLSDVSGAVCGATLYILFLNWKASRLNKRAVEKDLEERDVRGFGLILALFYFVGLLTLNLLGYKKVVLTGYPHLRLLFSLMEFGFLGLLTIRFFYLKRNRTHFQVSDWAWLALFGSAFLGLYQFSLFLLQGKFLKPSDIIWSFVSYMLGGLCYYLDKQISRFRDRILEDPIYKRRTWQRLYFFLPPLMMAALILTVSAQSPQMLYSKSIPLPKDVFATLGVKGIFLNYYLQHALEYFILGALYFRAVTWENWWHESSRQTLFWFGVVAAFFIFCILDECVQFFTPGRVGDPYDILANILGGLAALVIYRFGYQVIKKKYFSDECFLDARAPH